MKKILRLGIYIAAGIVAFLLLTAVAIKAFFPGEKAKAMIVAELSKRLDHQVSIETVSVGFYPDAEIVAGNVAVIDRETGAKLASIRKARFDLNVWQLIKGKYVIDDITLDSPSLVITRNTDGSLALPGLILASTPQEAGPKKQNGGLDIGDIYIRNGNLRLHDEASGIEMIMQGIRGTVDPQNDELSLVSTLIRSPGVAMDLSGKVSQFSKPNELSFQANASGHIIQAGPFKDTSLVNPQKDGALANFSIDAAGSMETISLNLKFSAIPSALPDASVQAQFTGTLQPREGMLAIDSLTAASGQSKVSLAGSCADLWSDKRSAHLRGDANIALGEIAPTLDADGIAAANIDIAASMYSVDMKTDVDLTRAAFTVPNLLRKESGAKSSLVADGRLIVPDKLLLDTLEFTIDGATIKGNGRLNPSTEPWALFAFTADRFPLERLDRLPSLNFEHGLIDISAEVRQRDRTRREFEYDGDAAITNALLYAKSLSEPVQVDDLTVQFETDKAALNSRSVSFTGSACAFDAEITDFSRPFIVGRLHADALDFEKITAAFAATEDTPEADHESPEDQDETESTFSAELQIDADSLKAGKLNTGQTKATMVVSDGSYLFKDLQTNVFEGTITGSVELDPSPQGLLWKSDFEGQGMRLKAIAKTFGEDEPKYQGALTASGSLGGFAASQIEDTLGSMEGTLNVTVLDGEIRDYLFLKNIILLMQFSPTTLLVPGLREVVLLNTAVDAVASGGRSLDPTRIRFSKINGSFQIENGVAHTEDLRLESGLANLLFKGDIDLGKNQLDMRVRATPLGSVGSLMGKVPVAGKTLQKGKETVLSTDFIARGPIADPEVKLAALDKIAPKREETQE